MHDLAPMSARRARTAPFLVWPVSRREFYITLQLSLAPTLLWGITLFGWRVLIMLAASMASAALVHGLLFSFTRRGKRLVFPHTAAAVLLLVALCHPMWPTWIVSLAAPVVPLAFFALGGPGRERIHIAAVLVILLQFVIGHIPGLGVSAGRSSAVLARDRLLMGDIRDLREAPLYHWPSSVELAGDDALQMPRPQQVAFDTLDRLSDSLLTQPPQPASTPLSSVIRGNVQQLLDAPLSSKLPGVESLILGAVPGRVGAVFLPCILLGGLYLAYRHILRMRSVSLFLATYALAIVPLALRPAAVAHVGIAGAAAVLRAIPGELLTLLEYAALNGDLFFAAIFILAFPGTEPLSRRGRRIFLILAAVLAAVLDRLNLNIPAATIAICLLMPLAPAFDYLFAKRSWLTRATPAL